MHYLSAGTIFRDETRYLREWIEYHLLVGVEHLYLLCNDDPDRHGEVSDVLGPYADRGVVSWDLLSSRRPTWQVEGWEFLLAEFGHQTEWLLLTDLDAFLYPVPRASAAAVERHPVPDSRLLVSQYARKDVAGLAVYTCTFGGSHRLTPPALQLEDLTLRAPLHAPCNWTANYVLRPARVEPVDGWRYNVPRPGFRLVDTDFCPVGIKGKRPGPLDVLRLNHYPVRSEEDWRRKVARGWPDLAATWNDKNHRLEDHRRRMLDRNDEEDLGMLRFVPRLKELLGDVEEHRPA